MSWHETIHEKLARLRAELARIQDELIDAETELADQMADIRAFEAEFEARVGFLMTQLAELEGQVNDYLDRIQQRRNESVFGSQPMSSSAAPGSSPPNRRQRRPHHRPVPTKRPGSKNCIANWLAVFILIWP